jgi:hypothetical protein
MVNTYGIIYHKKYGFVNSQSNVHSGKRPEVTMGKVELRIGKTGKREGKRHKRPGKGHVK